MCVVRHEEGVFNGVLTERTCMPMSSGKNVLMPPNSRNGKRGHLSGKEEEGLSSPVPIASVPQDLQIAEI